jgi:hypothetical protein
MSLCAKSFTKHKYLLLVWVGNPKPPLKEVTKDRICTWTNLPYDIAPLQIIHSLITTSLSKICNHIRCIHFHFREGKPFFAQIFQLLYHLPFELSQNLRQLLLYQVQIPGTFETCFIIVFKFILSTRQ